MKNFGKLIDFLSLDDRDRVDIILVSLGKKPAAIGELSHGQDKENISNTQFENDLTEIESIFKELGLNYLLNREPKSYPHFYVAQNRAYLDLIASAVQKQDTIATGKALGFPETAIKAFADKTYLKEPPAEIKDDESIRFLNFRLSPDHWREEYDTFKKTVTTIKDLLPEFYKKIVSK